MSEILGSDLLNVHNKYIDVIHYFFMQLKISFVFQSIYNIFHIHNIYIHTYVRTYNCIYIYIYIYILKSGR